jgi:hypothetical protein
VKLSTPKLDNSLTAEAGVEKQFEPELPPLISVSNSIYTAFAHIIGQMLVVYLWFIPHAGVAHLIPILPLPR